MGRNEPFLTPKTELRMTVVQTVALGGALVAAALWCKKIDDRTAAHDTATQQLQTMTAKIEKDVTELKTELMNIRKGFTLTPTATPLTEAH